MDDHPLDLKYVESALEVIPADDYDLWIAIVRALKGSVAKRQVAWTDEQARQRAETWSETSANWDPRVFEYKWTKGCKKDAAGKGRGIGTVFHHAKEHGWTPPAGFHFRSDQTHIRSRFWRASEPWPELELDAARAEIQDIINLWLKSVEVDLHEPAPKGGPFDRLALNATPASGKTHAVLCGVRRLQDVYDAALESTLIEIQDWHGETFDVQQELDLDPPYLVILVPTIALAEQVERDADQMGIRAMTYRGRNADPDSSGYCARHEEIVELGGAGPGWYSRYCHAKVEGEDRYCPHYASCPYVGQRNTDAFLRICTHDYLFMRPRPRALGKPVAAICDELPDSLVSLSACRVTELKAELPESEHEVVDRLLTVMQEHGLPDCVSPLGPVWGISQEAEQVRRFTGQGWYVELDSDLDRVEAWDLGDDEPKVDPSQNVSQIVEQIAAHPTKRRARQFRDAVLRFDARLLDGPPKFIHTAWKDGERYVMYQTRRELPPGHLLLLSGSVPALVAYDMGLSYCSVRAKRNEVCTLLYGYSASRTKVLASDRIGRDVALLAELTGGAVITYRDARVEKDMHFGQVEGLNDLQDRQAIIVVGRVEVKAHEIERVAKGRANGFYAIEPSRYQSDWIEVPGSGYEVRARTIDEGEHVRRVLCEAALDQAADRIRSACSEETKHVFMLNMQPTGRTYHVLVDWREVRSGLRVRVAFSRLGGVLPHDPRFLAERFPDLWETASAARDDLSRYQDPVFATGRHVAHRPGLLLDQFGELKSYRYRRQGQRGRGNVAWSYGDRDEAREQLSSALGQNVALYET